MVPGKTYWKPGLDCPPTLLTLHYLTWLFEASNFSHTTPKVCNSIPLQLVFQCTPVGVFTHPQLSFDILLYMPHSLTPLLKILFLSFPSSRWWSRVCFWQSNKLYWWGWYCQDINWCIQLHSLPYCHCPPHVVRVLHRYSNPFLGPSPHWPSGHRWTLDNRLVDWHEQDKVVVRSSKWGETSGVISLLNIGIQ